MSFAYVEAKYPPFREYKAFARHWFSLRKRGRQVDRFWDKRPAISKRCHYSFSELIYEFQHWVNEIPGDRSEEKIRLLGICVN